MNEEDPQSQNASASGKLPAKNMSIAMAAASHSPTQSSPASGFGTAIEADVGTCISIIETFCTDLEALLVQCGQSHERRVSWLSSFQPSGDDVVQVQAELLCRMLFPWHLKYTTDRRRTAIHQYPSKAVSTSTPRKTVAHIMVIVLEVRFHFSRINSSLHLN
jgi:hypothetical protein